ncbi:MAG TPA: polysaccharide deacetylase family protein [Chitinophagaceae bacterium]
MRTILILAIASLTYTSCTDEANSKTVAESSSVDHLEDSVNTKKAEPIKADATAVLAKKEVPILCYHRIKDMKPGEPNRMPGYLISSNNFSAQVKMLADSGYHSITPDEYLNYLYYGASLPEKPIMFTFDDTREEHYTIAAKELEKYGFKGVFFMMTISISRPNYMTTEQIKDLDNRGHVVASHTWDHTNVKKLEGEAYDDQFKKSKERLEGIIGKPVAFLAYPFGEWKPEAIPELENRGYKAAFQLSAMKRDSTNPAFSLRRMIVPGDWELSTMRKWMKINFK